MARSGMTALRYRLEAQKAQQAKERKDRVFKEVIRLYHQGNLDGCRVGLMAYGLTLDDLERAVKEAKQPNAH